MTKIIKTIVATTYPDANYCIMTHGMLKSMSEQINSVIGGLPVDDNNGKEIGRTIKSEVITDRKNATVTGYKLKVQFDVDIKKVDRNWEWFFVPKISKISHSSHQNKDMTVLTEAKIYGLRAVIMPFDLTLKPVII